MWADVDATTRAANLHVPHRQQLVVVMATAAAAVGAAMLGRIRAVSPAASHHHARSFWASDVWASGMDAMNAKGTGGDAPDKLQNGWLRHELSFGKRN